jgi:dihydrofolate synthase/folylpolyglutamate synthase
MDEILKLDFLSDLQSTGINPSLDNLISFLPHLNSPEKNLKCVLVGGTNGKGSTCAFLDKILRESGLNTGLFTSPHLVDPEERIRINGKKIDAESFRNIGLHIRKIMKDTGISLTFFEAMTAIALKYFVDMHVDFAVIEVGLGGRFDAANVVNPLVSIITNISYDHTELLGDTLEKIASEKAGIIKQDGFLITSVENDLFSRIILPVCSEKNTEYFIQGIHFKHRIKNGFFSCFSKNLAIENVRLSLSGDYQGFNASLAVLAAAILRERFGYSISDSCIIKGLSSARWQGRFQIVSKSPLIIIDGAHNPDGALKCRQSITRFISEHDIKKLTVIFGAKSNKDISRMIEIWSEIADHIIITSSEGLCSVEEIRKKITIPDMIFEECSDPVQAVKNAGRECDPHSMILITGSLYLLGSIIKNMFPDIMLEDD